MKRTLAVLAVVLVSAVVPVPAFAGAADGRAYAGTHVSFDTQSNAVVDYTVDGTQTFESVRVQSQSEVESGLGLTGTVDAAVADMTGASVSVQSETETRATVTADSGARIEAHDNGHGSLVVAAENESQYVALNLSGDAETETEGDDRVVVTTEGGSEATAMVVGEGSVSTENGTLTASLESDSELVVRTYDGERTASDENQEELIVDGEAAASVYVMHQGGANVTDTVTYDSNTTVTVDGRSESRVELTVSRSEHEGRVVIAHVEDDFESEDDVRVQVDGEAAASASSYSEVRAASNGGDTSKYVVRGSGSAEAETDVVVGVNHFSTRSVTVTDASAETDDGSAIDGDDAETDDSDSESSESEETDSAGDESGNGDADDGDSESSSDGDADDGDSESSSDGDADDGDSESSSESDDSSSGTGGGLGIFGGLSAVVAVSGLVLRQRL